MKKLRGSGRGGHLHAIKKMFPQIKKKRGEILNHRNLKRKKYFTNDVLSGIISMLSIPIDNGSFDKHGHGRSLGANVGVVLGPDETT